MTVFFVFFFEGFGKELFIPLSYAKLFDILKIFYKIINTVVTKASKNHLESGFNLCGFLFVLLIVVLRISPEPCTF